MAKPSITKRTTKGAALTYSELDTNFQNLADATVSLTADTGGTQVTADLNGNITLVAGTGVAITGNNTAKTVTITSTANLTPAGSNQQIQYNNNGALGASSGLVYDGTSIKVNGNLESVYSNGDEGGEIFLKKAATNTTITNGVTIDVFQNKLRIFENGGTNRGGYFDIPNLGAGVATNLSGGVNPGASTALAYYPSAGSTVDDTGLLYITSLGTVGIQSETSTGGIVVSSTDGGSLYMFDNGNTLLSTGTSTGYLQLQSSDGVVLYNPGSTQLFIRTQLSSGDYTGTISIGAKAFSIPNRTTTQRNALSATNGMMIYNTTDNKFQGYANGVWVDLH